jgi:CheY-like chemotaxis protein
VLIVDDDEDVVSVLVDGLTSYGHEARGVCTAQEALRALGTFRPELAIIDISLAWTDGWALAEQIGKLGLADPPKLIALSGLADDRDRERSLAAGFSAHLSKPVRMAKLDAYLRGRGPEPRDR